jgi:hypothetical protein
MAVFWVVATWCKFINVSEMVTASIIRAIRLHGATTQKTVIFIFAAIRT